MEEQTGSRRWCRCWSGSRSAGLRPSRAGSTRPAAPVRRAYTAPSPPGGVAYRASGHLQRAAVDGDLRAGKLDARALPVVDLDARRANDYLLAARGLQRDAADPRRVVEQDAVAALGLDQELLVRWRQQHGRNLRRGAEPAARPDRVLRVAVLELDPDPRVLFR